MNYSGCLSASKSLLNRCLVVQSYAPDLKLFGDSCCDDVVKMRTGLQSLAAGKTIDCGHAGTALRFLALRASRLSGSFRLRGSTRLMNRPQKPLLSLLNSLGVQTELHGNELHITGRGWQPQSQSTSPLQSQLLRIDRSQSSQFASAVLLNAWDLDFPIDLQFLGEEVSEGYWQMSLNLTKDLGMAWEQSGRSVLIPAHQKVRSLTFDVESDLSSAFALAALAVVAGRLELKKYPTNSRQPDHAFVDILKQMGANLKVEDQLLRVEKTDRLIPIQTNLRDAPDLFPVLAALCACAPGVSKLYGAPQLAYKESHRIKKMAELIQKTGRQVEVLNDGLLIFGRPQEPQVSQPSFEFDPDQDHRLAFAAQVFRAAGYDIRILHPEVVDKSFPEFWSIVEAQKIGAMNP